MREALTKVLQEHGLTIPKDSDYFCCKCGARVDFTPDGYTNSANLRCEPCRAKELEVRKQKRMANASLARGQFLKEVPPQYLEIDRARLPFPAALDEALKVSMQKSVLLFGPPGSGKTRIAWQMVIRWIERLGTVEAMTAFDMIAYCARLSQGASEAEAFTSHLREVGLLFLDDVFKAKQTERVEELIFSIIDYRGSWNLPTIVTLNDTASTLKDRLSSDRGPALIRRLGDFYHKIYVGPQQRGV